MTLRTLAWLLRQSLIATLDDGCFGFAKAAAYSALLSFFPLLTSAATILLQTRAEFVSATLEYFLSQIAPPGTQGLGVQQVRVMGDRPTLAWVTFNPFLPPSAGVWRGACRIARYVLAFLTTIAVAASLYYFGPYR